MICSGTLSFRKRLDSWFEDSPRTEDIEQSEFIDIFYSNNRSIFFLPRTTRTNRMDAQNVETIALRALSH